LVAPIISVRALSKVYGRRLFKPGFRALDSIDIDIEPGSVFGLLGPNGAGKTTLLKILIGLAHKTAGDALVFGEPAGRPLPRRRIGYLPEAHRLPNYLTGRQVLQLYGMMCGRDRAWLAQRIPAWIERVGMTQGADRKIREYSKGMQQRIGLASALIHEPELVFLDEPTDGVDPVGRAAIREIVLDLKRRGATVFINSHLLMEVELICDRVVIMAGGKVLRAGTIDELTPRSGRVSFEVEPAGEGLDALFAGLGAQYERTPRGCDVLLSDGELDQAVDRLRAAGVSIRSIEQRRLTLEQSFIELVKGNSK
jgi:ABC-2 type transport system ATP-binding protein